MFCLYCGTHLPDDAIFCRSCGKRQNAPAKTPATDITILPMPPLPGTSTAAGQPLVGNLPMVQGTPSTADGPPLGQDISHRPAKAAPSLSSASAPSQAASSARVAPPPHTEHQPHPPSGGPQAPYQPGLQTHPAHQTHTRPQHASSGGLRLTGHLSRRAVLLGLAGATTAVIAGGTLLALSHRPPQSPSSFATPTPTLIPAGTTLYTYNTHASGGIQTLAWSPNNKNIASLGCVPNNYEKCSMEVWNAMTGERILTYNSVTYNSSIYHPDTVTWSPDGKYIALGVHNGGVEVRDAMTGNLVSTYVGYTSDIHAVNAVAWSPNGKYIASTSGDAPGNYNEDVQVWDVVIGAHVFTYKSIDGSYIDSVAWSPVSKYIAVGFDPGVTVLDAMTGNRLFTYIGHSDLVNAVAWSPNAKYIASGNNNRTVQVWDAATGTTLYTYRGHSDAVKSVAWSPDGKRIASGSYDETVQVWDALTGNRVLTYTGHQIWVSVLAWSPDGRYIASIDGNGIVQIWKAP